MMDDHNKETYLKSVNNLLVVYSSGIEILIIFFQKYLTLRTTNRTSKRSD